MHNETEIELEIEVEVELLTKLEFIAKQKNTTLDQLICRILHEELSKK